MRRFVISLVAIVVVALVALSATLFSGTSPELGLDLQGGAAVVLRPSRPVPTGVLNQSIEIIRNRVDALGVAEPDIARQGRNIIVQLPGVKNANRALDLVGQTAELRFRPVIEVLPPSGERPTTTTTAKPAATTTTASTAPTTTTGAPPSPTTTARASRSRTAGAQATTTTTAAPTTTAPTTTPRAPAVPTTKREDDKADQEVVLPELDKNGNEVRRYRLGPAELTGRAVKSARAEFRSDSGEWLVNFSLTGDGSRRFDELAARNVGRQVAIVLDGIVESAPVIREAKFGGSGVISGDFGEREAKDLALVLRYGALPVALQQETVQTVSATLGKDSLRAGLAAGFVGLGLVLLYMVLYYRALGVVVLLGLGVWAALMYSIVSMLGNTSGLALSLAGAVGIIVSVGVTVDSYVVYFERLKDEVRSGKTIRSSVDRGFNRAFRTILAADISSFIGAALLYLLTVGSVRGFAFFLGLSTVLDVIVAYFFTRPLVVLLGRNRLFTEARWLGVARGLAIMPAEPRT